MDFASAYAGAPLLPIWDALCIALACSPVVFPWYPLILTPGSFTVNFRSSLGDTSLLTYEVLDLFDLDTTWSPSHGRIKSQSLFLCCGRCLDEQTRSC